MSRQFRRKKRCRFTELGITKVDYKDVYLLQNCITEEGKIVPSRNTGTRAPLQRQLAKAVKVARYVALLPYCDRHQL